MARRRTGGPDDPFAEMAAQARGERVTLYGVDPEEYARRMARTIDQVDGAEGDAVVDILKSIAGYKRDLGAALAYEQRKGLATGFRVDNADRVARQIDDATQAWVQQATGLTQDHLRQIADLGFDHLPTAIRKAGGVPVPDRNAYGARNQWAKNEFDIEVPSVSRRQLAAAFGGYQADLVQNLGKLARTEITAAVRAGVVGELAPGAVMSRIKAFLDTPERGVGRYGPLAYQAERVVRTETMRVFNAANDASSRFLRGRLGDDGMVEVWNHSSLPGSRPNHAALDGFAVKAGTKFTVGGVQCSGPHDPALPAGEVINCRCTKFLWNERWGPVPRGPRPQGTAFFDSARAKRNGWTKGDRIAGLGSAGPGEGGEDFGKTRGKGTGTDPIPPKPTPPGPPIVPPTPPMPIPPSIAPKPPGQVVVGKPAAGAKGPAKAKAYDPTKEYRSAAEVRAAILKEGAEWDAKAADARRRFDEFKNASENWLDMDDPDGFAADRARKLLEGAARNQIEMNDPTATDEDRRIARELYESKGRQFREFYQPRIEVTARLKAQGFTRESAEAARVQAKAELSSIQDRKREALLKHVAARDPVAVRPRDEGATHPHEGGAHARGAEAFGRMIDRRAYDFVQTSQVRYPGATLGSGTRDDPFQVLFTYSGDRAYYQARDDRIRVDSRERTVVHELGHWFESHAPKFHERAVDYLLHRADPDGQTKDQVRARRISAYAPGSGYKENELAFEDRWRGLATVEDGFRKDMSLYAGKLYAHARSYVTNGWVGSRTPVRKGVADWIEAERERGRESTAADLLDATEIASMGMEHMFNDAARFADADPEFFDFIYCLTKGLPWP